MWGVSQKGEQVPWRHLTGRNDLMHMPFPRAAETSPYSQIFCSLTVYIILCIGTYLPVVSPVRRKPLVWQYYTLNAFYILVKYSFSPNHDIQKTAKGRKHIIMLYYFKVFSLPVLFDCPNNIMN